MTITSSVEHLKALQRQRQFSIVSQSRSDRAVESYLARMLGYKVDADEDERQKNASTRKAIFAEAQRIRKAIESGKDAKADAGTRMLVQNAALARDTWDKFRDDSEKGMRNAVKSLPVYDFAQSVRGIGDLGLGIIIAESGDLSRNIEGFPSVAKVWKRLGLAVIEGERQQRKTDKDLAIKHGYSPKRRAEIWVLSDSMFRSQWVSEMSAYRADIMAHPKARAYVEKNGINLAAMAKEKDIDGIKAIADRFKIKSEARPAGPYGEVYANRRAATVDRGWTPKHSHSDAVRVMMKAFLRDLWRVWNGLPAKYADNTPEPLAEAAD